MSNHAIVAGALLDFVDFITNHRPSLLVGTSGEISSVYGLLDDFTKGVGLDMSSPSLEWQNGLDQPNLIKEVVSCPAKRLVKVIWGDDVVTYADYNRTSEIVHMMGECIPIERIGRTNPDGVIAF
jgi:hypothetical protein